MIDTKGILLHETITQRIQDEEDAFSEAVSKAMNEFNEHMNEINDTKGILYDRYGERLMPYE
jgi:uncharacterized protein (UPF0212 family)